MSTESMWFRMVKRLLPAGWHARKPVDVELNTTRLKRLAVNDATYNLMLDHAFVQFANDVEAVLDPALPAEARLAAANSAAGLRRYMLDVELRRAEWNLVREEEESTAENAKSAKRE